MRRVASTILFLLAASGCRQSDTFEGVYARCLCAADLSFIVKLEEQDSQLSLTLFRGIDSQLRGYVTLDGSFEVLGQWVGDGGNDPYPLKALSLNIERRKLDGVLEIEDFPNLDIKGEFNEHWQSVAMVVKANMPPPMPSVWLGEIVMYKVANAPDPETLPIDSASDTGSDTGQVTL